MRHQYLRSKSSIFPFLTKASPTDGPTDGRTDRPTDGQTLLQRCEDASKNAEVKNFHYWSVLVGRAGRSENGRRHFNLILCCFWAIISPHTKFHPNWIKNTEENFHFWSIKVGWAGRSKNGCSHFKHSIAVWKVIKDLCTKFQLNRMKIGQISPFLNFQLVGWLGRSAWVKLETKL